MKKIIISCICCLGLFFVGCISNNTNNSREFEEMDYDNDIIYKDGENMKLISKNGIDFIVNDTVILTITNDTVIVNKLIIKDSSNFDNILLEGRTLDEVLTTKEIVNDLKDVKILD